MICSITGYCRREAKQGILNVIKQIIWEQLPHFGQALVMASAAPR